MLVVAMSRPGASYSSINWRSALTIPGRLPMSLEFTRERAMKSHSSSRRTHGRSLAATKIERRLMADSPNMMKLARQSAPSSTADRVPCQPFGSERFAATWRSIQQHGFSRTQAVGSQAFAGGIFAFDAGQSVLRSPWGEPCGAPRIPGESKSQVIHHSAG